MFKTNSYFEKNDSENLLIFFKNQEDRKKIDEDKALLLTEMLGSGLTANVYLAKENIAPFKVVGALKIFKDQHVDRFSGSEIQNLKKINHPNVIRYIESG